jgi:GxxExxY protein
LSLDLSELTYLIRGAIFKVHSKLGPGLFESVYEAALIYELLLLGLDAKSQVGLPVLYDNIRLELGYRIDIIVNDEVIIEIKSVTELQDVHKKQVTNYLKLSGTKIGYLVNFNLVSLVERQSLVRIINSSIKQ